MNASANLRASRIRTTTGIEVGAGERRRIVQTLDYLEYRVRCDMDREASLPSPIKEYTIEDAIKIETSRRSQVGRMFTIFPYKDMNWIVTMLFVAGSISFVINAGFGLFPLLNPSLGFETLATVVIPATIMLGAAMFMTGGILGVFAAFNADRGTLEKSDTKSVDGDAPAIYRPALVGSEAWVWIPSAADFAALLRTVPFQAGLVMLSGGIILSTAAVAGFPGVLDPTTNFVLFQALVFMPQVIGGSLFFLANIALLIQTQERWFKPRFWASDWQGAAWNTMASAGFILTGVMLLINEMFGSAVVSFIASTAFLVGSVIQWYALMEFHSTPWAA
ncbi:integral membrane protein [Colletotrichum kahawae]|uniref:Integral membrane protein n=1 Tax=Colletotrichum kahawae TaxID=34407 RepID=A0AAD9YLF9_COLKA|nr:integral membrane protein [Colletotrichum kahawae]